MKKAFIEQERQVLKQPSLSNTDAAERRFFLQADVPETVATVTLNQRSADSETDLLGQIVIEGVTHRTQLLALLLRVNAILATYDEIFPHQYPSPQAVLEHFALSYQRIHQVLLSLLTATDAMSDVVDNEVLQSVVKNAQTTRSIDSVRMNQAFLLDSLDVLYLYPPMDAAKTIINYLQTDMGYPGNYGNKVCSYSFAVFDNRFAVRLDEVDGKLQYSLLAGLPNAGYSEKITFYTFDADRFTAVLARGLELARRQDNLLTTKNKLYIFNNTV